MDNEAVQTIMEAFRKRLAIYREKKAAADPMAEDMYNRHFALLYVIEAIELLAVEAGLGHLVEEEG